MVRYEHLEADLAHVLDRVGIGTPVELDRLKSGFRLAEPEFTPELDAYIAQRFRREIDHFGYVDRSVSRHV